MLGPASLGMVGLSLRGALDAEAAACLGSAVAVEDELAIVVDDKGGDAWSKARERWEEREDLLD